MLDDDRASLAKAPPIRGRGLKLWEKPTASRRRHPLLLLRQHRPGQPQMIPMRLVPDRPAGGQSGNVPKMLVTGIAILHTNRRRGSTATPLPPGSLSPWRDSNAANGAGTDPTSW